jgi:hypothetical protein
MRTIKQILTEMKESVENQITHSPGWWIDRAIELNVLWQDLTEEMTKYEMLYKSDVCGLVELGESISKAELKVQSSNENYKMYQYLKGRNKIIEEFIRLAKARAKIENNFD